MHPHRRAAKLRPLALALTLALAAPASVLAEGAAIDIRIAAQPLGPALNELARQAKLQLLVAPALVAGKTAPAVQGSLAPEEALRRLLAGSGLRSRVDAAGTIVIVAAPVPASAAPQQDEEAPSVLAEVVVTGEKTQRSLARTAASVSVVDSRSLIENPALNAVNTVLDDVANVTATGTQNLAPAVRGVDGTGPAQGADAFLAGTRPRLNIQIDGRAASYNEVVFGDFSLWDVEQVEVFRGAQSLLQGRNAIAGTVIVKSNDPGFEREIGARVAVGNHAQRQYSAVFNTPLVQDELAFRLALDRQTSESFVDGFQSHRHVSDPGEFEATTLRAKLLIKPKAIAGFSTLVTLSHSDYRAPQTESVKRPFGEEDTSYPAMPVFAPRTTSAVVDTTWKLSDAMTFENRLSLADFTVERLATPGDGNVDIDGRDFALEPRLRFASGKTNGFVGAHLFRAKQDETIDLAGGGAFDDKTTTAAVYGEATTALRPDLDLTVGARYERETRRRTGAMAIFAIDLDETYHAFMPKFSLAWQAAEGLTLGGGVSRGYNGGGAGFTYDVPFTSYTFEPEYVWNYELFARASLLDGKLRLTGNLFYSDYKDMQLPFDLNPDPSIWSSVVRNADRAETYGAEIGAKWLPMPTLQFNAELGLLKTRIRRYEGSGIEGNELPRAPALSGNLGVSYRHGSGFEAGANARYSESYYSNVLNTARGRTDPYWIVNARIGQRFGKLRVFAYANNLFDSDTPILIEADPAATAASDTAILPRPRTVGVGVEAWF